jgi:hypothetical protein
VYGGMGVQAIACCGLWGACMRGMQVSSKQVQHEIQAASTTHEEIFAAGQILNGVCAFAACRHMAIAPGWNLAVWCSVGVMPCCGWWRWIQRALVVSGSWLVVLVVASELHPPHATGQITALVRNCDKHCSFVGLTSMWQFHGPKGLFCIRFRKGSSNFVTSGDKRQAVVSGESGQPNGEAGKLVYCTSTCRTPSWEIGAKLTVWPVYNVFNVFKRP